ncbi:hypothetical protein OG21DRAFT_1491525 [Imleria badia]|nr:hypothetical protein OG21DRAFT_1491525 [Imleria badia]
MNIQLQLWTWNNPKSVEPTQTLVVFPPSQKHPPGCYNCGIASLTADSDLPVQGLSGNFVV